MSVPPAAANRLVPVGLLLLSLVSLCVGTSFGKTLFPVVGTVGATALRIGLGALMMVAVQRPWRWRLDRDQARAVVAYGVVLACMNLSFYAAVARLPLGVAIAIEFLGPLGVALAGSRRPLDIGWALLAAIGVAALVLPGQSEQAGQAARLDPVGVGFALLAALFWAGYILTGARAVRVVPEYRIVCLGLCVASIITVPAGVAQAGAVLLQPAVLAAGTLVALLCSALPYTLEIMALKRLSPATFGILVSLEPGVGALAALAILGERLTLLQLAGIACVIATSAGSTLARPRPQPPVPATP